MKHHTAKVAITARVSDGDLRVLDALVTRMAAASARLEKLTANPPPNVEIVEVPVGKVVIEAKMVTVRSATPLWLLRLWWWTRSWARRLRWAS